MKKPQHIGSDDEHKVMLEDYLKALNRIGKNREDFGVWLLQFAQMNLSKLSSGDMLNLAYEILVFSHHGMQGYPLKPKFYTDANSRIDNHLSFYMIPGKDVIEGFQKWFLGLIEAIIKKKEIEFEYPQKSILIPPDKEGEVWTEVITTYDLGVAFSFVCIELIKGIAHKFKQCQGCKAVFLMNRSDQDYCSGNCQARTYMKIKRSKGEKEVNHGKKKRKAGR